MDQCTVTGQHDYERLAYAVGGIWWQVQPAGPPRPVGPLASCRRASGCLGSVLAQARCGIALHPVWRASCPQLRCASPWCTFPAAPR